jgi:16S rRNA (uracil1498-N3)-methyltransferase
MKHFLLPRRYAGEPHVTLSGDDLHYLTRVLRKRVGDCLPALAPSGARYTMRIEEITRAGCAVSLIPDSPEAGADAPRMARIRLLQCLPKGKKMDLIVRQAVEAGVSRIVPLMSARSITVPEDPAKRSSRWRRIAREALQQSGNTALTAIDEPVAFMDGAGLEGAHDTGLFFHQERLPGDSLHGALSRVEPSGMVSLCIGPEGGLSDDEVDHLRLRGFRPVYLGDTVLRTETAALYAVAVVRTILRERDTWKLSE